MHLLHRRRFLNMLMSALSVGLLMRSRLVNAIEYFTVNKTDAEWKKILTTEQYRVLRDHGTEYPNSSPLTHENAAGIYNCVACELPLFSSETKFDSGTGWPSFYKALPDGIGTSTDHDLFYSRIEVHCHQCGGHLGHVFDDGPAPTFKRYCMNGVALKFVPKKI